LGVVVEGKGQTKPADMVLLAGEDEEARRVTETSDGDDKYEGGLEKDVHNRAIPGGRCQFRLQKSN